MPWTDQFSSNRGIRNFCRKKIIDTIFIPLKQENEWKVLVVDDFGMKILSSCFKTEEVMGFNIALIELLEKPRESLPYLSAVYLLYPSVQNIGYLLTDLAPTDAKYLGVHLFFLTTVSPELYEELLKFTSPGSVLSFNEIDFLFIPYESQVFSLNDENFFPIFFDAYKELDTNHCAFVAKKLATFCVTLNVRPKIRYRRHFVKNFILAEALKQELENYRNEFSSSSDGNERQPRCEILILDRGFDCVSPLIHEFTLQAMTYDLLNIEDDIYKYSEGSSENVRWNEISLTEADDLWCNLRHAHIANVSKVLEEKCKTDMTLRGNATIARFKKLPDLGETVRRHLAYKINQEPFVYRRMANECMKIYCNGVNVLAEVEQDLAAGAISVDEMKNALDVVLNILRSEGYSLTDKLRILLLYLCYSKGTTKQEFDSILTSSGVPFSEARFITNVLHLDVDIFRPGSCKPVDFIEKEADDTTVVYKQSRWIPAVKNIMLSCIDGSLSEKKFPYLEKSAGSSISLEKRTGYWYRDKKSEHTSRLIIFIGGGVTYSEMRAAYEVTAKFKAWEVLIGGDSLLTPEKFLKKLKELRCFISKDM